MVGQYASFGNWVRLRRKLLNLTQADLALQVSCSLSMLRKIERGERQPSDQLAELLADRLAIPDAQRGSFLQMARGLFVPDIPGPSQANRAPVAILEGSTEPEEERAPFVARRRQLRLLHEHLDRSIQGQGRLVYIVGEAGLGKTSLLYEFARQALETRPDLIVAGGSCDVFTGQGEPLLPFRDIFRLLVGDPDNADMQGMVTRNHATHLMQAIPTITEILLEVGPHLIETLLPEAVLEASLAQRFPYHPKSSELLSRLRGLRARWVSSAPQELRRDHFFDEIATTLKAVAQRWPLILMLDDLHWIDHSSAALLGHLAMRLKHSPILIVGSYRPEDLVQGRPMGEQSGQTQHPLQELLSESLRQFGQNRIDLDHFESGEELEFVNAYLDVYEADFSQAFRNQLARLTEGNPLFVVELLRDMRERGDIFQGNDGRWRERSVMNWDNLPARVEGVIEKRIARLPTALRGILGIASVQGETFYAEVVAQVAHADSLELTRGLSTEVDRQHRLIRSLGVRHIGPARLSQYRFRHHLIQKYIYGSLSEAERMYLHEAVGNALEAILGDRAEAEDALASQLARHFQEAHLVLKASRYLLLAGRQAIRLLAYDEASVNFEQGISLLEKLDRTFEVRRLEYEMGLALAQAHWHSGRVVEAVTDYQNAMQNARALDDPDALARAALAYEEPRWRLNLDADLSQQYLREALAAIGEVQSGLRVRLLVGLSRSLQDSGEEEELRTTVEKALHLARQINDPLALCDALRIKIQIDRRPETTAARLSAIQELIDTAESIGDRERLADGFSLYVFDLLGLGQLERLDEMIAAHRKVAEDIKQPFQLHIVAVFRTMRAILSGEFGRAERLANEAAEIARQIGIAELDGILGIHMFTIRREQGRIREVAPIVQLVVENNPASSTWRPGLALIHCILGQRAACQAIFESLASDSFALVPQDSLWVATLAYLSEVCTYLEDADRAGTLYKLLLPYEDRAVVAGAATACYGAAGRYLGMLAKTMADWKKAELHFERALALDERSRAWPWLAHSQYEYATMLLERGQERDRERANTLLQDALNASRRMGMLDLAQKITNFQSRYERFSSEAEIG